MKETIRQFIRGGGDFESTAMALYRWQRTHNPEYDRFCGDVRVREWSQIPAVPTGLFRDLALTCFPADRATVVFRTSGTTAGRRGAVRLLDADIYRMAARTHAVRCIGDMPHQGVSFVPTASDSSLGHMCADFVPDMPSCFHADTGVDAVAGWAHIRAAAATGNAVFIPGTAFALADLIDAPHDPVALPIGSTVMVTGGFKGRRRTVSSAVLHARLQHSFQGANIVAEYGMSELASQLWAVPAGSPFVPPPWLRVMAVDPWTGQRASRGVLRFVDLANHQTVLAIETADVGVVHSDGTVTLEGRLEGALPRGCSLTVEESGA